VCVCVRVHMCVCVCMRVCWLHIALPAKVPLHAHMHSVYMCTCEQAGMQADCASHASALHHRIAEDCPYDVPGWTEVGSTERFKGHPIRACVRACVRYITGGKVQPL
jgi:hypothetical protein